MYKLVYGTREFEKCMGGEKPWRCFYEKFGTIFEAAIGKMMNASAKMLFEADTADESREKLDRIREIMNVLEEKRAHIEKIIGRCMEICAPSAPFTVYFLPVPVSGDMIVTQHSEELGAFVMFGVAPGFSADRIHVYLPHEYAHVVRIQNVLLPQGVDSPYQMRFSELAVFEGLGVAFSMLYDNEFDPERMCKYIDVPCENMSGRIERALRELDAIKDERITPELAGKFYGEEKTGYVAGTALILRLVQKGYDICALDKMQSEKILSLL
ncbi:MAG: DUF2268 domain-containing protein [Euryarchaeota archaeon]|nr:DUF2268 domain-containing protein [Euryarchaeota archaeon]